MSQIEKEEELKIKVEYGMAVSGLRQFTTIKESIETTQMVKCLYFRHRSGRRSGFEIPEPFHKLIYSKMRGKFARRFVEFTLATYDVGGGALYAISIKHKSDNFRRSVAREIVTGRIKRYLKDAYKFKKQDFIHIEKEVE